MKKIYLIATQVLVLSLSVLAQSTPTPALVGYWHNWDNPSAPYIQLDQIDPRYNVVAVSFAENAPGSSSQMNFTPFNVTQADLISKITTLKNNGKKVIISIGGQNAHVVLNTTAERDAFVNSMKSIIYTYDFDGMDVDIEGGTTSVTPTSTISNPTDNKILMLIQAIKAIMGDYYATKHKHLILTMAPEAAYVQGGKVAYGGIWGGYLPIIHALRDSLDILQVQLYNTGGLTGLDNNNYNAGTADFIVAMTEMLIKGFSTAGGNFVGLPANKVAVALPACTQAGQNFISPAVVKSAINYLMGKGPKPGSYTLQQAGGYPTLKGMMTWSINWDAVSNCNNSAYQYAANFQSIFGNGIGVESFANNSNYFQVYPNPASSGVKLQNNNGLESLTKIELRDMQGRLVTEWNKPQFSGSEAMLEIPQKITNGIYLLKLFENNECSFVKINVTQ